MIDNDFNRATCTFRDVPAFRLGIVPYLLTGFVHLIGIGLGAFLAIFFFKIGLVVVIYNIAKCIYDFIELASFRLYADDEGIWFYRGILPWARGASGMRWRDLEIAGFRNGFGAWATNAYTVELRARFDSDNPMVQPFVADGKNAALYFNRLHKAFIEHGSFQQAAAAASTTPPTAEIPFVEIIE